MKTDAVANCRGNIVWTALAILASGLLFSGCASAKSAYAKPFRVLEGAVVPDTVTSDHKPIFVRLSAD